MKYVGKWLGIKCFKHDGSTHRVWDRGFVLENNEDYVIIASKRAKVVESNGRRWFTKEPAVTIFSKKEWWNTICMFKRNGGICYYCNIASPCLVGKDYITYIDYDLDAKLFPDKAIKVLDEREYAHHKNTYGYSEDLDKILKYQTKKITDAMSLNIFPFDDDKIRKYYDDYLKLTSQEDE